MKNRRIRLFVPIAICIVLLFCSCTLPYEHEGDSSPITDESGSPYADSPPEDSLYTIQRGDDCLYLTVRESRLIESWKAAETDTGSDLPDHIFAGSMLETVDPVTFPSVADMKDRVLNYKLSEDELKRLYLLHGDDQDRIVLYDLYSLTDPSLPATWISDIQVICGSDFSIEFALPSGRDGCYLILSDDIFDELSREYDHLPNYAVVQETYTEAERNATVYDYTTALEGIQRQISYTAERNGTVYKIVEKYNISAQLSVYPISEDSPYQVKVFYETDGYCYMVVLHLPAERPSVEWLTSFGVAHTD